MPAELLSPVVAAELLLVVGGGSITVTVATPAVTVDRVNGVVAVLLAVPPAPAATPLLFVPPLAQ